MPRRDIIVLGGSAGSIEVLLRIVRDLPRNLPAAVFVAVHLQPEADSHLPAILSRSGPLPAEHGRDGEPIKPGRIYVAPPDRHLMLERGRVRLLQGPRENGFRPAVDALFRTAATAYRERVIGVVLSGALDDGTAGLHAIKTVGGLALVQDPADALVPSMPRNAMDNVAIDASVPSGALGATLVDLVKSSPEGGETTVPDNLAHEAETERDPDKLAGSHPAGQPSAYSCPDCRGVLWELRDGDLVHYRCRVGHAYSSNGLLQKQADVVEEALWVALRSIEERESLMRRLKDNAADRGLRTVAQRYAEQMDEMVRRAKVLRDQLYGNGSATSAAS